MAQLQKLPLCTCIRLTAKRFIIPRKMSAGAEQSSNLHSKLDHMDKTADNTRQPVLSKAIVSKIEQISPTVKALTLRIQEENFSFKAGQWVDLHIPRIETIGGFSISSSPHLLHSLHLLELAVKFSNHPPAKWIHTKCTVGSEVNVRVGGDFCYDPKSTDPPHNILLIAGGVGINPLLSIMRYIDDMKSNLVKNNDNCSNCNQGHLVKSVKLLFSAASREELVFQDKIEEICKQHLELGSQFHITQEKVVEDKYKEGRIQEYDIRDSLKFMHSKGGTSNTQCYICGPPPMIDDVEKYLQAQGISPENIHYEKWW